MKLTHELPSGFLEKRKANYVIPAKARQVMAVEMDLLLEFDRVCKANNLRYWLIAGSLLGAVRHDGFIPWDDDIDVGMSRSDYNKLSQIATGAFSHPYFWQTNDTDPGTCRGHAQLRNSETTAILKGEMRGGKPKYRFNQGIFIDVFPFDKIPDDPNERTTYIDTLIKKRARISQIREGVADARSLFGVMFHPRALKWWCVGRAVRFYKRISGVDILSRLYRAYEKVAARYIDSDTKFWAEIAFYPSRKQNYFSRVHDMDELVDVDFEGVKIPAQKNYIERLEYLYGDWHEHIIGGAFHGGILFDTVRPYTYYFTHPCK